MAGFDFSMKKLRGGFFDAKRITTAADRAAAKVQSKFGAFTRRTMKNSIKYRPFGAVAPPGKPPFAHRSGAFTRSSGKSGRQPASPLRELIFFARDRDTNSVVVGPVAFGSRGAGALEKGGTVAGTDPATGRPRSVRIRPHPFARPAGEAEAKKLPDLLKGMIN